MQSVICEMSNDYASEIGRPVDVFLNGPSHSSSKELHFNKSVAILSEFVYNR